MTKQEARLKIDYLNELRKELLIKNLSGSKSDQDLQSQISELKELLKSDK